MLITINGMAQSTEINSSKACPVGSALEPEEKHIAPNLAGAFFFRGH